MSTKFMNDVDCVARDRVGSVKDMNKRRQFVLDEKTNRLLEDLAADHAGNLSFVVREAIQVYADLEADLERIEADPGFQAMMRRSEDDIRAGRLVPHSEVKKRSAKIRRKR